MPRLLLIEDDKYYCEFLGRKLAGRFDICFVHSLEDGIAAMRERQPDAVLMDLSLPDSSLDPLETLARVKTHRTTAPINVLTGNPDVELHRKLLRDTASGVFLKDVNDQDAAWLENQINRSIDSQRFLASTSQVRD